MLRELEEKACHVKNPSSYIHSAVQNEVSSDAYTDNRIYRRCLWLNTNVFWHDAITKSTIAALSTLEVEKAMDIVRGLENKASKVNNPSGYLRAAVRKEWSNGGGRRPEDRTEDRTEERTAPEDHQVARRAEWLNTHMFWRDAIAKDALQEAKSESEPKEAGYIQ